MRMLANLDELMNSTQVMIVRGVVLRHNQNNQNDRVSVGYENTSCVSFVGEVQRKASRFINNSVLEFDLASMLAEGEYFRHHARHGNDSTCEQFQRFTHSAHSFLPSHKTP